MFHTSHCGFFKLFSNSLIRVYIWKHTYIFIHIWKHIHIFKVQHFKYYQTIYTLSISVNSLPLNNDDRPGKDVWSCYEDAIRSQREWAYCSLKSSRDLTELSNWSTCQQSCKSCWLCCWLCLGVYIVFKYNPS